MRDIFIYLLVDCGSEGIIHTFLAPNDKVAMKMLGKWLTDPNLKDSVEPNDFVLVKSKPVSVYDGFSSFTDDVKNEKMDFVCYGDECV